MNPPKKRKKEVHVLSEFLIGRRNDWKPICPLPVDIESGSATADSNIMLNVTHEICSVSYKESKTKGCNTLSKKKS